MSLQHSWYVIAGTREVGVRPLRRMLLGTPVVVFRDGQSRPHALIDRCCHRNVPLSLGRVEGDRLRCAYHGWEFSGSGTCERIPGRVDSSEAGRRKVPAYAVAEQDGFVWMYADPSVVPERPPARLPHWGDPAYRSGTLEPGSVAASMEDVLDNFMDTQHPAFLHRGLLYDDRKRVRVRVVVDRTPSADGIEAIFLDEPPMTQGLIGRIFAGSGQNSVHTERYLPPSVHQLEYRIGEATHVITTQICTPEESDRCRIYAAYSVKFRFPVSLLGFLFPRLVSRLLRQDLEILGHQSATIRRFGTRAFSSTELDLFPDVVRRFFRHLEAGEQPSEIEVKPASYEALL